MSSNLLRDFSDARRDFVRQHSPVMVCVKRAICDGNTCRPGGLGSGSFILPGVIKTNSHVVRGATDFEIVTYQGLRSLEAHVIFDSPGQDLAFLRVTETDNLPTPLPLAKASLSSGEYVCAFGFPLGAGADKGDVKPSFGSLRGSGDLEVLEAGSPKTMIRFTETAISPGNSGGPLVSMNGEIAGTIFAYLGSERGVPGMFLAIDGSEAHKALASAKLTRAQSVEITPGLTVCDTPDGPMVRILDREAAWLGSVVTPQQKIKSAGLFGWVVDHLCGQCKREQRRVERRTHPKTRFADASRVLDIGGNEIKDASDVAAALEGVTTSVPITFARGNGGETVTIPVPVATRSFGVAC